MGFPVRHHTEVKEVAPKDNLKRLLLHGVMPDGWVHARMEIEFKKNDADSFWVVLKFYSINDGSLVKELKIEEPAKIGDTVKLIGIISSYQLTLY
jgi:hypothetical protein